MVEFARSLFVTLALSLASAAVTSAQGRVLPLPEADQQRMDALLGAGVIGKALPSAPIDDPLRYFPLQEKTPSYQVTSGKHAGETQTLSMAKGRRPSGTPAWRFQLSPTLSAFVHATPDGDLMMPAVIDAPEGVVVITTPPNPFVLKGMQPGQTRSFAQKVAVNYLDDPTDQRFSGSLSGTYTYLGTFEVTVPAGTFPAVIMRVTCQGKVGPAETQDLAYYVFAPGVGVIAMISQEEAEAFWIIHIDSTSGRVLASTP